MQRRRQYVFRFLAGCLAAAVTVRAEPAAPPVPVDFFFEPGCADCREVRQTVLPELAARYDGLYRLRAHDVGVTSNALRLIAYREALNASGTGPVSIAVDDRLMLTGIGAIREGLFEAVDRAIEARLAPGWQAPAPIPVRPAPDVSRRAASRLEAWTLAAVVVTGFADGINPCAMGAIVFLVTLFAATRAGRRKRILLGSGFCLASFVTYTAIGFGLLHALHALQGFALLQRGFELVMIGLLLVLASLSFGDALRFHASGHANGLVLKLPRVVLNRTHRILRTEIHARYAFPAGLVAGAAVTALETVCTGQAYVPALVMVIKQAPESGAALGLTATAWRYLLAYNTAFLMPLIGVFLAALIGAGSERMAAWSRRNVVPAKLLLGLVFCALALLLWLR